MDEVKPNGKKFLFAFDWIVRIASLLIAGLLPYVIMLERRVTTNETLVLRNEIRSQRNEELFERFSETISTIREASFTRKDSDRLWDKISTMSEDLSTTGIKIQLGVLQNEVKEIKIKVDSIKNDLIPR